MILRYAILYVDDVAATLDFYERAFAQTRAFLHEAGDYGELATGGTKLAFSARSLMRSLGKDPGTADPASPVFELAFETVDVQAAYDRALAAGAAPVQPPKSQPWGQVMSYVSDPNGFLIELCSPVQKPNAD